MMQRPDFDKFIADNMQHDKEYRLAATQTFDELYISVLALNSLFGDDKGAFSASDVISVASMIGSRHKELQGK